MGCFTSRNVRFFYWLIYPCFKHEYLYFRGYQFYLVLDVVNVTNQEMELKYTTNKSILMEEKESYRIPVPVDRFLIHSLEQVRSNYIIIAANNKRILNHYL